MESYAIQTAGQQWIIAIPKTAEGTDLLYRWLAIMIPQITKAFPNESITFRRFA